ncbi:hypothetical protein HD554DRAFT_603053 [Boletus coccyginus]|nr:hypothetical protein HD554DRAFT_603053 [Boletus coccyginus]
MVGKKSQNQTHREVATRSLTEHGESSFPTASHIISSPNHAQLEMRILANYYGTDKTFAFLRGRCSRVLENNRKREGEATSDARNGKDPASNGSHIPRRAS